MHASTYRDALMCWNSFRPGLGKKPYVCVLLLKARKPAIEMNRKAFVMRSSNVQFTHHAWHTMPATRLDIALTKRFLVSCYRFPRVS